MRVGTICARNYLASALLLAQSLRQVHPDWPLSILLVDIEAADKARYQDDFPGIEWLAPDDLLWDDDAIARMKLYYDVIELSTALKPALLEKLLSSDEMAMYLDPDIEVFGSLGELETLARDHHIVLLPHVTKPVPRDQLDPKEETFLLSGQFNLGFIAVTREAAPFLQYWNERLELYSKIDHANGYFTDQRWVDAVPSLFNHVVVKRPGYNVAYWNLHEYELTTGSGKTSDADVLVNGEPLRFFHYSGHSTAEPTVLSKFAPDPRVRAENDPVLLGILQRRTERVLGLNTATIPYRWNRLPDGRPVCQSLREGFWLQCQDALVTGGPMPPSPFSPEGTEAFDDWAEELIDGALPRIALVLWRGNPILQSLYPNPTTNDRASFVEAMAFDQDFLSTAQPAAVAAIRKEVPRSTRVLPGFNLIGYLAGEFGMGAYGRLFHDLIAGDGLPVSTTTLSAGGYSHGATLRSFEQGLRFSINLLVMNADAVSHFEHDPLWSTMRSGPIVGAWAWELPTMSPELVASSRHLTEIWCGSTFIQKSLQDSGVTIPVRVHPLYYRQPMRTHFTKTDFGLSLDRFTFGFAFDASSVPKRKNPIGLLTAYLEAFDEDGGAELVIKVMRGQGSPVWSELETLRDGRNDVHLIDGVWSEVAIAAFYQVIDAYISLHRSEGIGLTLFNAMASGTPVIATGWSGNMDFMNADNSILIPFAAESVGSDADPYPPAAIWAEPDREAAKNAMQSFVSNPRLAEAIGKLGQTSLENRMTTDWQPGWFYERFLDLSKGVKQ
jgi:glycosyltransferase involved in cell wall biosynthesis